MIEDYIKEDNKEDNKEDDKEDIQEAHFMIDFKEKDYKCNCNEKKLKFSSYCLKCKKIYVDCVVENINKQ